MSRPQRVSGDSVPERNRETSGYCRIVNLDIIDVSANAAEKRCEFLQCDDNQMTFLRGGQLDSYRLLHFALNFELPPFHDTFVALFSTSNTS